MTLMYVLQARDPEVQLRNELIHTYDEAVRLDGSVAVVHTDSARRFLMWKRAFLDITDQMLDRRATAKELGVTIPNVDMWVKRNQLKAYGSGRDALFMEVDVQAFHKKRGGEKT